MSTAKEVRNRIIRVPIDGTNTAITCRRPDPFTLITQDLLPLSVFHAVLDKFQEWDDQGSLSGATLMHTIADDPKRWNDFIDRWVCAAAVEPRVVLTEDESSEDVLWVQELDFPTKSAILGATMGRTILSSHVRSAIEEFRRHLAAGAGTGSNGEAVRDTPVGALVAG